MGINDYCGFLQQMHQLSLEMHTDLEVQGLCLLCVQLISFAIVPLLLLILVILHHQTQHHALTNVTLEYAALKDKVSIFVSAVIETKIVHSITCTDICIAIIILILQSSVSTSGRSREAIRPELKIFLFLHRWTWTLHV